MSFASTSSSAAAPSSKRNIAIAGGVVLLHVGVLWALQSGLLRRAVEVVVPVAIMTELIEPPKPVIEPPPPPPAPPKPRPREPIREPVVRQRPQAVPPPPPAPRPVAVPNLPPAPAAPVGVVEAQPPAPPITAPVAIAPPPPPAPPPAPPAPAPARVQLPSSDADYLQNPKPVYPPISKRMGEQGKVVVRVLIGVDGTAQDAQLKESSGFDRLDRAGMETARKWRYVPGKRNGVPEAMWFNVPIHFVLEQS